MKTIFHAFDIPKNKVEEFWKEKKSAQELIVGELMQLASENGLEAKPYDAEEIERNGITGSEDIKAFIIVETCDFDRFHSVALVSPEAKDGLLQKKGFHSSDSGNQQVGKVYPAIPKKEPCTLNDALLDYQKTNNVTVYGVLTFRKVFSADGIAYQQSTSPKKIDATRDFELKNQNRSKRDRGPVALQYELPHSGAEQTEKRHVTTSYYDTASGLTPPYFPIRHEAERPASDLSDSLLRKRKHDKAIKFVKKIGKVFNKVGDVGKEVFHQVTSHTFENRSVPSDSFLDRERNYPNLPLR